MEGIKTERKVRRERKLHGEVRELGQNRDGTKINVMLGGGSEHHIKKKNKNTRVKSQVKVNIFIA